MTRSSHIDRQGVGAAVMKQHKKDVPAPQIAAAVGHGVTVSQVHRYVQKHAAVNSVVSDGRTDALRMLTAAVQGLPDRRDRHTEGIEYFGGHEVPTTNIFGWYYDICRSGLSGQVTAGFEQLALKLTVGVRLVGTEQIQPALNDLSDDLDLTSLIKDIARSVLEMGTVVVVTRNPDEDLIKPIITPVDYITMLTDRETIGSVDSKLLIKGDVTQIVHAEGTKGQFIYTPDDVAIFTRWAKTNYFTDILGRQTYGIWGMSKVPGVAAPLKSMLNASYHYDEFIKRYGMGRLHIDMKMVSDMLKADTITDADATTMQESEAAALQNVSANQDLITLGDDVNMIETKQAFDITKYLAFREAQINAALGISDVAAGKVSSSWTSSGVSVHAQEMLSLQSMRGTIVTTMFRDIITPHLEANKIDPNDVMLFTEPLSQVNVSHRDLLDAADRGVLTDMQVRERMGFPAQLPDEDGE